MQKIIKSTVRYFLTGKMVPYVEYVLGIKVSWGMKKEAPDFVWATLPFAGIQASDSCTLLMKCIESCNIPEKFISLFGREKPAATVSCPTDEEFRMYTNNLTLSRMIFLADKKTLEGIVMEGKGNRAQVAAVAREFLCVHRRCPAGTRIPFSVLYSGPLRKPKASAPELEKVVCPVLPVPGSQSPESDHASGDESFGSPAEDEETAQKELSTYLKDIETIDKEGDKGKLPAMIARWENIIHRVSQAGEIGQFLNKAAIQTLYKEYDPKCDRIRTGGKEECAEIVDYGCRSVLLQRITNTSFDQDRISMEWPDRKDAAAEIARAVVSQLRMSPGSEAMIREMHEQTSKIFHRLVSQGDLLSQKFGDLSIEATNPQTVKAPTGLPKQTPPTKPRLSTEKYSTKPPYKYGFKIVSTL